MAQECGGCVACCFTRGVLVQHKREPPCFQKAVGVLCSEAKLGSGCAIYARRPHPCKNFVCAWLRDGGPHERRPDIFGVVEERGQYGTSGGLLEVVLLEEYRPGALEHQGVCTYKQALLEERRVLIERRFRGEGDYVDMLHAPLGLTMTSDMREDLAIHFPRLA